MVEIKELTFVAWKKSKPKKNLPKPRQNIHQKNGFGKQSMYQKVQPQLHPPHLPQHPPSPLNPIHMDQPLKVEQQFEQPLKTEPVFIPLITNRAILVEEQQIALAQHIKKQQGHSKQKIGQRKQKKTDYKYLDRNTQEQNTSVKNSTDSFAKKKET